jgi:hypothetical protein
LPRDTEARDIDLVISENSSNLSDDARPVKNPEMEEGSFRDNIEVKTVKENNPAELVREDRSREAPFLNVCFNRKND